MSTSLKEKAAARCRGGDFNCAESTLLEPRDAQSAPVSSFGLMGALGNPSSQGTSIWSLSEYKENVKSGENASEKWDELERSIVASIADDISVGIIGNMVEMTISKRF